MNKQELALLYTRLIRDELELQPEQDGDEDDEIGFGYAGDFKMYFHLDAKDDPEYMMLSFPNFADRKVLDLTRDQLLLLINKVNYHSKAAKLYIDENTIDGECDVMASIECFMAALDEAPSVELLRATIRRNISALLDSARMLVNEARELPRSPSITASTAAAKELA